MRYARFFIAFLIAVASAHALGHPGGHGPGGDPIDQKDASSVAEDVVQVLLKEKRLTASWGKRQLLGAKLETTAYGPVWVISYRNPAEPDAGKQMLYVLLDDVGNYLGAGHTIDLPSR